MITKHKYMLPEYLSHSQLEAIESYLTVRFTLKFDLVGNTLFTQRHLKEKEKARLSGYCDALMEFGFDTLDI